MSFAFSCSPKRLTVIRTHSHTLMAAATMQGADQHVRSSLGFLPMDTLTCRPGESNQRPPNNKTLALPPKPLPPRTCHVTIPNIHTLLFLHPIMTDSVKYDVEMSEAAAPRCRSVLFKEQTISSHKVCGISHYLIVGDLLKVNTGGFNNKTMIYGFELYPCSSLKNSKNGGKRKESI